MARAAIIRRAIPKTVPIPELTAERVLRLVRFPFIRAEISKALVRAVPEGVDVKPTWRYVWFRLRNPKDFHPALFARIPVGARGTLLTIGTPHELIFKPKELEAFLSKMGWDRRRKSWIRRITDEQRRSMIYQLRAAGIIGGARMQAVGVPRFRVEEAVRKFSVRPEVRRIVSVNKPLNVVKNPILATLGVANPPEETYIRIPFRDGQEVSPDMVRRWLESLPDGGLKRRLIDRFEKNLTQYRRFHLGAEPRKFVFKRIPLGSSPRIEDVDFVTGEGKEWMAPYQVPPHSGKYRRSTEGRYMHAHGESAIDMDIKRPAPSHLLPDRFHTPDGKFIGVVPSKNVKIKEWYVG